MPVLSPRQIYALAADAGFKTPGQAITMTAIALAESGGNSDIVGHNRNGTIDVGLWQINSVHGYSESAMKDPRQNAAAAKKIHEQQGYTAWVAFTTTDPQRSYRRQLPAAINANPGSGTSLGDILRSIPVAAGVIPGVASEAASAVNPLAGLGNLVELASKAGTFLMDPQNWLRIAYVVIGGALIIGGLVVFAQPAIEPVAKAAGKAADIAL